MASSTQGFESAEYLLRFPTLHAARFVARRKRFIVDAVLEDGRAVEAHLGDPGRLEGILHEGARVWLEGPFGPPRKLPYSLRLAQLSSGVFVMLESQAANRLVPLLVHAGVFPELPAPEGMRREVRQGKHRLDLAWTSRTPPTFVEIKTVTHALSPGLGGWPDAPSKRGTAHASLLTSLKEEGADVAIVFVAGRGDLHKVVPFEARDPAFAKALRRAKEAGVKLLGVTLEIDLKGVRYRGPMEVAVG